MVIYSTWYSPMLSKGTIGIVWNKDEITGEIKTYIGIADGNNQKEDEERIAGYGSPIQIPLLNAENSSVIKKNGKE